MASKYFLHVFVKGGPLRDGGMLADTIGVVPVVGWKLERDGIRTFGRPSAAEGCWFDFGPGNRLYLVENHGQCREPNGDIVWRNEDGASGDEKIDIVSIPAMQCASG